MVPPRRKPRPEEGRKKLLHPVTNRYAYIVSFPRSEHYVIKRCNRHEVYWVEDRPIATTVHTNDSCNTPILDPVRFWSIASVDCMLSGVWRFQDRKNRKKKERMPFCLPYDVLLLSKK